MKGADAKGHGGSLGTVTARGEGSTPAGGGAGGFAAVTYRMGRWQIHHGVSTGTLSADWVSALGCVLRTPLRPTRTQFGEQETQGSERNPSPSSGRSFHKHLFHADSAGERGGAAVVSCPRPTRPPPHALTAARTAGLCLWAPLRPRSWVPMHPAAVRDSEDSMVLSTPGWITAVFGLSPSSRQPARTGHPLRAAALAAVSPAR